MHRITATIRRTIRAALSAGQALVAAVRGLRAVLEQAAAVGGAVVIGYRKEDGTESLRVIEPHRVWPTKAGHWAVRGHDQLRGETRTFRLDRIVSYAA